MVEQKLFRSGLCAALMGALSLCAASVGHAATPTAASASVPAANATTSKSLPAAAVGSSTSSLQSVATPEAKRTLSFKFYTRNDLSAASVKDSNPDASEAFRVSGTYSLSDAKSIGYVQQFSYQFAKAAGGDGPARGSGSHVDDGWLNYTDGKIGSLPGDWNLALNLRLYLPIGETSRFVTKRLAQEMAWVMADKSFGKLDLSYSIVGIHQTHTQDYSIRGGQMVANQDLEFDQSVSMEYHLLPYLSLIESIGTEHRWTRSIPGKAGERTNFFMNEAGISAKPVKNIQVQGTISTETRLEANKTLEVYRTDETTYQTYLIISI